MEKLIKDGKVAVLFSPGFGAGWSTWNGNTPEAVFNKEIAEIILKDGHITEKKAEEIMDQDFYCGGAWDLEIEWLDKGTAFRITEYDGSESIEIINEIQAHTA